MLRIGVFFTIGGLLLVFGLSRIHTGTATAEEVIPQEAITALSNDGSAMQELTPQPTGTPPPYALIFSAEPGPDVSTL